MKRNILAAVIVLTAALFSCTTQEEPFPDSSASTMSDMALVDDGTIVYESTVTVKEFILDDEENPDTKTVLTISDADGAKFSFANGDRLGVFPCVSNGTQMPFELRNDDASRCTFNCPGFALTAGTKYAAYYTYNNTTL